MSGGVRRGWLVARREWNQRVRSLAFRVSTILSIVLVVVLIAVPEIYGGGAENTRTVGVVGRSSSELPMLLRASGEQLGLSVKVRTFDNGSAGRAALRSDEVAALLVDERELVWKAAPDAQLKAIVTAAVHAIERDAAVEELGLTPEEAQRLVEPPELRAMSLDPVTEELEGRQDLARIALVLLFLAIAFYGGYVLTGVVEEKSSRVVEVLLSRLRPSELLAGKILGIGLVGLAQFALVMGSALVALAVTEDTPAPTTATSTIAWMVFWFVLGYGFYSVAYATAGSLISRQEEAQSIQFPVTGILLVGYLFSFAAAESPESAGAVIASLVPPTAPMVMIARIAHGAVPLWQMVLSVALMVATVYGMVRLAGRIYAGGVLRFGRRVRLREAWRGGEA
ncbi:MAG TPA: ABC transporter permease [Actinomycetota bacterium]|nr:ABC transporter permease [Actinomycetota bacterium]